MERIEDIEDEELKLNVTTLFKSKLLLFYL